MLAALIIFSVLSAMSFPSVVGDVWKRGLTEVGLQAPR
jgi:hypothetical protein